MAEADKKRIQEALERAKAPKRPTGLGGKTEAYEAPEEAQSQDDDGWKRPERVEHTSEKEHPPGKE
jgi:hypothetical protein